MALNLQNFQDGIGPIIASKWLNAIDRTAGAVSAAGFVDPTGQADSSPGLQTVLNSGATYVVLPCPNPGAKYILGNVNIPSGVTLDCSGAYIVDKPGCQYVFMMTGFTPRLIRAYISSALNATQAAIVIENVFHGELLGCQVYNSINAYNITQVASPPVGSPANTDLVFMLDCYANTFTGIGCKIDPNVAEVRMTQCYFDAGLISGGGGLIPRPTTTGVLINGTGSTFAFGGHLLNGVQCANTQDGFYVNNSNLVLMSACIADDNSGRAFAFDGNTSQCLLTGCFTGPAAYGVSFAGSCSSIWMNSLQTIIDGNIPPGGGTTWYTSATNGYNNFVATASFFDIITFGTADVTLDAATWLASQGVAHKYFVTPGSSLNLTGGADIYWGSDTTLAANTTGFYSQNGYTTAVNSNAFRVPYNCVIQEFHANFNIAPGANTYTFTLYVNGVATALTGTVTGAGFVLDVVNGTQVGIAAGSLVQMAVNNPVGGAPTYFNGSMKLLPQP